VDPPGGLALDAEEASIGLYNHVVALIVAERQQDREARPEELG
jgi:hypothetical protein